MQIFKRVISLPLKSTDNSLHQVAYRLAKWIKEMEYLYFSGHTSPNFQSIMSLSMQSAEVSLQCI